MPGRFFTFIIEVYTRVGIRTVYFPEEEVFVMTDSSLHAAQPASSSRTSARALAEAIDVPSSFVWLFSALVIGLLVYYFVGIDQGATSVFGNDMHIHEWVHDSRHFLGFPCH